MRSIQTWPVTDHDTDGRRCPLCCGRDKPQGLDVNPPGIENHDGRASMGPRHPTCSATSSIPRTRSWGPVSSIANAARSAPGAGSHRNRHAGS